MARAAALALLLGATEGTLNLRDRRLDEADVDLGCIFDCDWIQGDDVNVCVSFDSEADCSSDCTEDVVDWLTEACTARQQMEEHGCYGKGGGGRARKGAGQR